PTTGGTGSDAQSYALISHGETHEKMACGDRKARFRLVVLDPTLALSAPPRVAAVTGFDALSHAVESHVSKKANPVSRLFSRAAWGLLAPAFERVVMAGGAAGAAASGLGGIGDMGDMGDMGDLLFGAHLAGAAIEASMLGGAHAAANPLTARFGVVHGVAVALLLPHVVRFNASVAEAAYKDLTGLGAAALAERIAAHRRAAGLPEHLADLAIPGLDRSILPVLAREATGQWTGTFNPRPLTEADFLSLYETAF
ncbi:MAG TPA: iron-containing alcohol dehydrogenase, partial [Thermoanaerobaculia bacterium]|nr:iron-containing alcohol dehydrogenase [Thermoanaerobaculia bacterium]